MAIFSLQHAGLKITRRIRSAGRDGRQFQASVRLTRRQALPFPIGGAVSMGRRRPPRSHGAGQSAVTPRSSNLRVLISTQPIRSALLEHQAQDRRQPTHQMRLRRLAIILLSSISTMPIKQGGRRHHQAGRSAGMTPPVVGRRAAMLVATRAFPHPGLQAETYPSLAQMQRGFRSKSNFWSPLPTKRFQLQYRRPPLSRGPPVKLYLRQQ